jgi:hypothetical protein
MTRHAAMDIRHFVNVHENVPKVPTTLLDRLRPQKTDDVLLCDDVCLLRIRDWISRFRNRDPSVRKMLMISGPSGVGKSILATLALQEAGYRHVRVITSANSKKDVGDWLSTATTASNNSAFLIDDVDVIQDHVPGIVHDIVQYTNPLKGRRRVTKADKEAWTQSYWRAPVVVTCKRHDYGKIVDVAKQCDIVWIPRPPKATIVEYLVARRAPNVDRQAIEKAVDVSRRDIRQAIMALDFSPGGDSLGAKDEDIDALHAIDLLMKTSRNRRPPGVAQSLRLAHMDLGIISMMVFENYLDICDDLELEKAAAAIDSISLGDVAENSMYATGRFDLHDVCATFSVVAPSMIVRTQSTHAVRFGNLWSKVSNMYVKKATLNRLRDGIMGVWMASDVLGRHSYIDVLKAMYAKHIKSIPDLARVCLYPDKFIDVCRFGLKPAVPLSVVSLQTVYKRMVAEQEKKKDLGQQYNTNTHT